jgi:phosphoadenosine phosphosulfate reductase
MISGTLDYIEQASVEDIALELEGARPADVLRWSYEEFGPDVAMATGFGLEGCVLISMLAETGCDIRLFYLDTDLLFPETYALRDTLESRYGVRFERRCSSLSLEQQSELYGEKLWERRPDECCRLRKVEPLREMLSGLRAWITGIRRDQSPTRANAGVVEYDRKFELIKINPLVRWTAEDVKEYARRNDVPYNPLIDQGYTSIGCRPCTTVVQIGEHPRAGRWRGTNKTECGIHLSVDSSPNGGK